MNPFIFYSQKGVFRTTIYIKTFLLLFIFRCRCAPQVQQSGNETSTMEQSVSEAVPLKPFWLKFRFAPTWRAGTVPVRIIRSQIQSFNLQKIAIFFWQGPISEWILCIYRRVAISARTLPSKILFDKISSIKSGKNRKTGPVSSPMSPLSFRLIPVTLRMDCMS